jgi:hypothetical protein
MTLPTFRKVAPGADVRWLSSPPESSPPTTRPVEPWPPPRLIPVEPRKLLGTCGPRVVAVSAAAPAELIAEWLK